MSLGNEPGARDERERAATPVPGVLVADDDPVVLSLLRTILERRGFSVWTAESGNAAIDQYRLNRDRIAVVLLDVRLGQLDGPQTLQELRRVDPEVTCFFMTAHAGQYSQADLLRFGALDTFQKPFQLKTLTERLWQTAKTVRGR